MIKNLFRGWTTFEIIWLIISTGTITLLSFLWDDTLLGFTASITGVICVVLAAKGKIANFYFGIVQAATYGYLAYTYGLYGESMLNLLFYLPIQFLAFYAWLKHNKSSDQSINGEEVYAKRLTKKQWFILAPGIIVACAAYGVILSSINAQQVRLDSIAVVLSVVAQFLLMFRYAEQWLLWIIVNILSVILWFVTLSSSNGSDWTVLAMFLAFLVNSVYGYVNWLRISQQSNKRGDE